MPNDQDREITLHAWPPTNCGGQQTGAMSAGVLAVHVSGVAFASVDDRSQRRNRERAIAGLREILAALEAARARPPASATRCGVERVYVQREDPDDEICGECGKHIRRHYGGSGDRNHPHVPYRCDPASATPRYDGSNARVDAVARLMMDEWHRVEGERVNVSRIATFADMARRVLRDFDDVPPAPRAAG